MIQLTWRIQKQSKHSKKVSLIQKEIQYDVFFNKFKTKTYLINLGLIYQIHNLNYEIMIILYKTNYKT